MKIAKFLDGLTDYELAIARDMANEVLEQRKAAATETIWEVTIDHLVVARYADKDLNAAADRLHTFINLDRTDSAPRRRQSYSIVRLQVPAGEVADYL